MAFDNLPPGVSPSDIPGNRPEDEEFRKICERLRSQHPEWTEEQIRQRAEEKMEDSRSGRDEVPHDFNPGERNL